MILLFKFSLCKICVFFLTPIYLVKRERYKIYDLISGHLMLAIFSFEIGHLVIILLLFVLLRLPLSSDLVLVALKRIETFIRKTLADLLVLRT